MFQENPLAIGVTGDSLSRQCRRCLGITDSTSSSAVRCDRSDMRVYMLHTSCVFVSCHQQSLSYGFGLHSYSFTWGTATYLQVLCGAVLQQILCWGGPDRSCDQRGVLPPPEPSGQVRLWTCGLVCIASSVLGPGLAVVVAANASLRPYKCHVLALLCPHGIKSFAVSSWHQELCCVLMA